LNFINKILIIIAVCFFLVAPAFSATTYYVATDGDDSTGDGSARNEWRHIDYGVEQMSCGDTLIVRDGDYTREDENKSIVYIDNELKCTSETWATIKAENKWGATLDGASLNPDPNLVTGFYIGSDSRYIRIEGFEIKNVYYGIRLHPVGEDEGQHIYLYRLKVHDVHHTGINMGPWIENATVDSCVIYNIYGEEGRKSKSTYSKRAHYYYHHHCIYMKGKENIIINNVMYQPIGGQAIRIDGSHGNAPAFTAQIINNTFHGSELPCKEDPECCPDVPCGYQSGLISFYRVQSTDNPIGPVYIENNIGVNPPGIGIGYDVMINVGLQAASSCAEVQEQWKYYEQNDVYIRNNVTTGDLLPRNGNCDSGWGALSSNKELKDNLGFTNQANNDYSLTANATLLINQGYSSARVPKVDHDGKSRNDSSPDIGAFEYGM
jgi:hypothetical protein